MICMEILESGVMIIGIFLIMELLLMAVLGQIKGIHQSVLYEVAHGMLVPGFVAPLTATASSRILINLT